MLGLDPSASINSLLQTDIDRDSQLLRAATPILDRFAEELAGERFGLLLTDDKTRIIDRRVGLPAVAHHLDSVSAAPGVVYSEDVLGTNALGTANETRAPVAVVGEDHFNESLREFCCFAAPIRNSLTGRVHGVLNLCGHIADQGSFLRPYLLGIVRRIEQRLAEGTGESSIQLLAEYRATLRRPRMLVIALNDEVTLTSRAAQDLLDPSDYALFEDSRRRMVDQESQWDVVLTRGTQARAYARRYPGGGALFRLRVTPAAAQVPPRCQAIKAKKKIAVVSGELGSGRTTQAMRLLGGGPIVTIDCVGAGEDSSGEWLTEAEAALRSPHTGVLVENAHLLPDPGAVHLAKILGTKAVANVAITVIEQVDLSPAQTLLVSLCTSESFTVPLRRRRGEIPGIANEILHAMGLRDLRISAAALSLLVGHEWRGNLAELKQVLTFAAAGRPFGDIRPSDLPSRYRQSTAGFTRMERAEREAIIDALVRSDGHRASAAEYLGISRRTIFNRIRVLRITDDEP